MTMNSKSLVICYENGAMQLMSREDDPAPIILDVDMHVASIKWNDNGSMLAVAGYQLTGDKTHNFIHFYSPWGEVCCFCFESFPIINHFNLAFTIIESNWQEYCRLCMGSSLPPTCYRN